MANLLIKSILSAGTLFSIGLSTSPLFATPSHGIAMYGEPQLPANFQHLPYADPHAPKGGEIITGEGGSFDSLNPFILKGSTPWQLRFMMAESLMGRAYSEPFTLYCLLCETIETDEERSWVEYKLREEAKFSDGTPVTVEDVIWSFETLGTIGHGRYHSLFKKIENIEKTAENKIKFSFNEPNRELALLVGIRPILQKAYWDDKDFTESGLDQIPVTSAPYVVSDAKAGSYLELSRNPDYWGQDLPFMRGQANFDKIRLEYFAEGGLVIEAFKAGDLNAHREFNIATWENQYNFPAVENGDVIKEAIGHQRPSGMTGYFMNTRQEQFKDWRVRQAMIEAFNFNYINEAKTQSKQKRITSYFSNSPLGMKAGPAQDLVAELLAPYKDDLLPDTLEGYTFPEGSSRGIDRKSMRKVLKLMSEAGWNVVDGIMQDNSGKPFEFDFLLKVGDEENASIVDAYTTSLRQLGIQVNIQKVDSAQYTQRLETFDYGMIYNRFGLSLSPGTEQYRLFGTEQANTPGTRNVSGIYDPVIDAMIGKMLSAESREQSIAATRALDRVLTAGRYTIPLYFWAESFNAYAKELKHPVTLPLYGDWIMWRENFWYWEED